jgi:hypothetical protein
MKWIVSLLVVVCAALFARPVQAGPLNVSATISGVADGADFDYTITLTNSSSSTDSLETFWFAWVPGQDYLPTKPISETSPSGWSVNLISHNTSPPDGYAIRWVTTTAPLMPGQSLTFGFTSADSPATIAGDSAFFAHPPIGTSFVYQDGPFQGASAQFVAQSVPEPSTLTLGIVGGLGCVAACRVRRAIARRRQARLVSAAR